MKIPSIAILLAVLPFTYTFSTVSTAATPADPVIKEQKNAPSGTRYNMYFKGRCALDFVTSRPDMKDPGIVFCVPAAFTTTDQRIDGVYISDGKIGNENQVNKKIGGAFQIVDGEGKIFPTRSGTVLSREFLRDLASKKGSLFQQFQAVLNGKGEKFTDNCSAQRRGIAIFQDGRLAIIESLAPVTLTTLGTDAASMGVQDLVYCDMGPWSEGWYRSGSGKTEIIGQDRSLTYRQTNWLILRQK